MDILDPKGELRFEPTAILPTEYGVRLIWDITIRNPEDLDKVREMYLAFSEEQEDVVKSIISEQDKKPF